MKDYLESFARSMRYNMFVTLNPLSSSSSAMQVSVAPSFAAILCSMSSLPNVGENPRYAAPSGVSQFFDSRRYSCIFLYPGSKIARSSIVHSRLQSKPKGTFQNMALYVSCVRFEKRSLSATLIRSCSPCFATLSFVLAIASLLMSHPTPLEYPLRSAVMSTAPVPHPISRMSPLPYRKCGCEESGICAVLW